MNPESLAVLHRLRLLLRCLIALRAGQRTWLHLTDHGCDWLDGNFET